MRRHLDLSFAETQSLNQILTELSEQNKHPRPLSLDRLLQRWEYFVSKVERTYNDSIYEYTNELSIRDIIEDMLSRSPDPLRDKVMALVQEDDNRFAEVTRPLQKTICRSAKQREDYWWWLRIPKKLSKELENDLRSEGTIE